MLLFLVIYLFFIHNEIMNHVLHILKLNIHFLCFQSNDKVYKYVDDPSSFIFLFLVLKLLTFYIHISVFQKRFLKHNIYQFVFLELILHFHKNLFQDNSSFYHLIQIHNHQVFSEQILLKRLDFKLHRMLNISHYLNIMTYDLFP